MPENELRVEGEIITVMDPATSVDSPVIPPESYHLFTACTDSSKNLNYPKGAFMLISSAIPPVSLQSDKDASLRAKSQELEAAFLAEMLSHAGFGAARESFGGGIGEEQFASFLRSEQASGMVAKGGIGLAEYFFQSMTAKGAADA